MRLSRRAFLALTGYGVAGAALASATPRNSGAPAAPTPRSRARYFLHVTLGGGIDTIYTFDPKQRREVASSVDVPYKPKDIVAVGNVRLGPHAKDLAPWAKRLAIVRGVNMSTVAHEPGFAQAMCARRGRGAGLVHVPLAEVIASQRDSQTVSTISLGDSFMTTATRELSQQTLRTLLELPPDELAACGEVLKTQRAALARQLRAGVDTAALDGLDDTIALVARLPTLAKPELKENWSGPGERAFSDAFQYALWIFENDLARSVRLFFDRWDSHVGNHDEQTRHSTAFFAAQARFLREMETRKNQHGTLFDNTLMLMGSELGRFPELNALAGKHHFPEAPYVLMGPGIEGGRIVGETGRRMEALPTDLSSGRPSKRGTLITLDDIGASMIAAAGLAPKQFGYHGRVLGVVQS